MISYLAVVRATEVPAPPGNISTSLRDNNLLVNWSLPKSPVSFKSSCFKYQLDIGDGVQNLLLVIHVHQTSVSSAFEWILLKTGSGQKYSGGAVLHGAERGPQPDLQGEDEGEFERHLSAPPSLE